MSEAAAASAGCMRIDQIRPEAIRELVGRYALSVEFATAAGDIAHSYWGAPEAGIAGHTVFVRADTPVHSLLHELCHIVCMTDERRSNLARDAGGDPEEECAVCYLQILLADALPGFGKQRCLDDMDAWGYSFREGSVRAWFTGDGREARTWLQTQGLINPQSCPTWRLRR